jgi:hypothetical protein
MYIMVSTRTRVTEIFIAGEKAPSAEEVFKGESEIVNQFGNIALKDFRVDELGHGSEVCLDESVQPPVLRLKNAMATVAFGFTDAKTGEFNVFGHELSYADHPVSGTYKGPGSKLELYT